MKKYTAEWLNGYVFEFWIDYSSGLPERCRVDVVADHEYIESAQGSLLAIMPEWLAMRVRGIYHNFDEAHHAFSRAKIRHLWTK